MNFKKQTGAHTSKSSKLHDACKVLVYSVGVVMDQMFHFAIVVYEISLILGPVCT